jgi:hypothetical protein
MEATKQMWTRPELTVLVRNRPEEAVLTACKLSGGGAAGPAAGNCAKPAPGCIDLGTS